MRQLKPLNLKLMRLLISISSTSLGPTAWITFPVSTPLTPPIMRVVFPNTSLIYQISGGIGGKEVIVAINFAGESLQVEHGINTSVLGPGDVLEDVIGNSIASTVTVSNSNTINIQLPARSYTVWVEEQAPLPVELLHFDALALENAVQLQWGSGQ